jgi:signal transduction histidine kinase
MAIGQNPNFKNINKLIENGQNYEAIKTLKLFEQKKIKKDKLARTYFYLGLAYGNENKNDTCYSYLTKSKKLYTEIDSIPSAMEVNLELAYALSAFNYDSKKIKEIYREYISYAEGTKNSNLITKGYHKMASYLIVDEPKLAQKYFFKALKTNKKTKDEKAYRDIIFSLAGLYCSKLDLEDSALYYYDKALVISTKNKVDYEICVILKNKAHIYNSRKDYYKAIALLKEAQKLPIKQYVKNINSYIHLDLATNYASIGNYSKAYTELSAYNDTNEIDAFSEQNKRIQDLQTKYDTKNKELENLSLKTKSKNTLLLVYLFIGLLVIVSFIGYLRINFLHKMKKIAEQEKQIEAQKLTNLLKEQELKEIDKLLEGQEKERIKIANDLHDNLGSMMATLKLNFQNLKRHNLNTPEEDAVLFEKTDALLDEAYQKIRGLAHTKNAGVIANEGLLPAILNMSKKATVPGRLTIEVVPFGLDERIDSTIEVNIFRMIQEILTNAIKHAEATVITIHLTQHHDSLNIIIEDNGKGFVPKKIDTKEGMGLPNIEKKVEHMGGTFTIDSSLGKGTSILIDLPL